MIRDATGADVAQVVAWESSVFGADAWGEAAVRDELTGPGRRFVVAETPSGDLRGYAVSIAAGDLVDLARIAVAPEHRRSHVATDLLAALLADTGAADRMLLEVRADNPAALAFYERSGFERIDVRRRYYADGADAVVMVRKLAGEDGCHG